jgi:hypothetical protein
LYLYQLQMLPLPCIQSHSSATGVGKVLRVEHSREQVRRADEASRTPWHTPPRNTYPLTFLEFRPVRSEQEHPRVRRH